MQIHLAGHTRFEKYLLDTHSGRVIDDVWALYHRTIQRCGSVSTLVEWDDDIPELEVLLAEAERARRERDLALTARVEGTTTLDAATLERVRAAATAPNARSSASEGADHGWKQGGPRETARNEAAE